jgi:hypothetical protein
VVKSSIYTQVVRENQLEKLHEKRLQQGNQQRKNQGSWKRQWTTHASVANLNLHLKNDLDNNMQIMVWEPKEV